MKDYQKIEDLLLSLEKKSHPHGLKERIVGVAKQEVERMRPLVNSFKRVAAVCSVCVVAVFLLESKISEDQFQRISVLEDKSFESEIFEFDHDLAIILGPVDMAKDSLDVSWVKNRYFKEKRAVRIPTKKREWNQLMEDLNGS